ncbi:MAG: GIY-YIG nuclease family protein [Deltaproteobacteria bacterium]|nr:GIY-YIG nuclease family protein [Deltaproteobacteria bacterium]
MWYVYICDRNGQLYTGITTDVKHRMSQHGAELLCLEEYENKQAAAKRERVIKGWRREKKLDLIRRSQVSLS